jgi:hypothetical protein
MFRRMQDTTLAVGALAYGAALVHAWRVLPGPSELKLQRTAIFPALFLTITPLAALLIPVLRATLTRHLWISYRTGFGQSVISVFGGVSVLIAACGFIFWQIHAAAHGGRYPGGAFSGYAAGIGLLLAQAILVRRIEADPVLRGRIEEP